MEMLAVYKALGDDTRFALFRELTLATTPLSASALADRLGLHPNTVRPHLERMREVGLVEVEPVHRGTVGRPQHRYAVAAGAPGLGGVDPPAHTLLAGLLGTLAEQLGAVPEDATDVGRSWGAEAASRTKSRSCVAALAQELDHLGFNPVEDVPTDDGADDLGVGDDGAAMTGESKKVRISFLRCPFRELAEAYPELVCNLHRGLVEGLVDGVGGGMVDAFNTLYDREPCNVTVVAEYPGSIRNSQEDG